jgi:hypothetical protein
MAEKARPDKYANYAIASLTESAANTLTFKKLETGFSLFEKVAWIINRIEYWVQSVHATMFNGGDDTFYYGMSVSASFATALITEATIIDYNALSREDIGTAASGFFIHRPFVKDFSTLPGGGILVPPSPLYLYGVGSSLNSAQSLSARIHYTMLSLSAEDYIELENARRILSS